jgi:hypothetical protein
MKRLSSLFFACAALSVGLTASAQTTGQNAAASPPTRSASSGKPDLEVVNFKVGSDYHPMLDRGGSMMTADNPDFPVVETERGVRRRRSNREDNINGGKLRSHVKVIDNAQWVQVTVKNGGPKTVKAVEWDFAFPRLVGGRAVLRFDVSSQVEIKPGKKKTLKQALPPGARGCEMMVVRADANGVAEAGYYGGVCGHPLAMRDPEATNQEAATIKRVEYADGSVWVRP